MLEWLKPEQIGAEQVGVARIFTAACGLEHAAAVAEEGALYTWGAGQVDFPGSTG